MTATVGQDTSVGGNGGQRDLTITGTATLNNVANAGIIMTDTANNRNLTFENTLTSITLGNNTSFLNNEPSGTLIIQAPLNMNGKTLTVGGTSYNGAVTMSGAVTNNGTINLAGGTLTLSASSDNVGLAVNANAGTVIFAMNPSAVLVHATGANSSIGNGGTIQLGGTGDYPMWGGRSLTVNSGGLFDLNGRNQNYDAQSGNLNLNGTGISSGGALINSVAGTTSALTFGSGGIVLQANSSIGGAGNITVTTTGSGGIVSGSFNLTKVGTGTLTLVGKNTYVGYTTNNAGKFQGVTGGSCSTTTNILNTTTATNSVSITDNTKGWTNAAFTAAAAGVLEFDFGSVTPSATVSPFVVTGAATFTATPSVRVILPAGMVAGSYPLMTWGSKTGTQPGANLTVIGYASTGASLATAGNTLSLVLVNNLKANNQNDLNLSSSWTLAVPTSADLAIWDSTVTSANTTSLGANTNWAGIQIKNPGGLVTINAGNTLTNGSSGIDMSSATADLTLNCDVALGAANTWNVTNNRTLTVGGVVSGANALTKSGAGTATLTGNNNFSGALTVNGGTMGFSAGTTTGGSSTATVNTGGTLSFSGGSFTAGGTSTTRNLSVTTNGSVTISGAANVTFPGFIALGVGTGSTAANLTLSGGTLNVNGADSGNANRALVLGEWNSLTNTFTMTGGTLNVPNGRLVVGWSGTGVWNMYGGTVNITNLLFNQAGSSIAGTTFTLTNGQVNLGSGGIGGPNAAMFLGGGTLSSTASWSTTNNATLTNLNGSVTFAPASSQTITWGGILSGTAGGLTVSGPGTLNLTNVNTYSGATAVTGGKLTVVTPSSASGALNVSANATLGVTVTGAAQWSPASLSLGNPCTLEFANITSSSPTTPPLAPAAIGSVANVTININSISGVPTPGSYPLIGNAGSTSGYSLGTQPSGVIGHLGVSGTTLVYVVDSSTDIWAGTDSVNPTFWDINASTNWIGNAQANPLVGSYTNSDAVQFDDTAVPASPVTVDIQTTVTPGNTTFANTSKAYIIANSSGTAGIGGSSGLTKSGSGTVTITSSNSFTGVTAVNAGVVNIQNASALGSTAGGTTVGSSAVLQIQGGINFAAEPLTLASGSSAAQLLNVSGNNTWNGTIATSGSGANSRIQSDSGQLTLANTLSTANAGTQLSLQGSGNIVIAGQVTGPGGLTSSSTGAGVRTISNPLNDYTNATTISGGTLQLGAAGVIPNGSGKGNVVASGGKLDLNTFSETINGLSGSGTTVDTVAGGTPVLTVGDNDATASYSGSITNSAGTLSLVKIGNGTQSLSGTSGYAGSTTVSNGILELLRPALISSTVVSVQANGNLLFNPNGVSWGTGHINPPINLNGGTLSNYTSGNFYTVLNNLSSGAVTVNNASTIGMYQALANGGTTANSGGLYLDGGLKGSAPLTVNASVSGAPVALVLRTTNSTYSGTITVNGVASAITNIGSGLAVGSTGTQSPNLTNVCSLPNASITVNGTMALGYANSPDMSWAASGSLSQPGITGTTFAMDALNGPGVVVANFSSAGGTRTLSVGNNNGSGNFSGVIAAGVNSTLSLIKNGSGTQTLAGANTYTGTTTVNAGTLGLGRNNALPSASAVVLSAGTLDAQTFANTAGTLTVSGAATNNIGAGGTLVFANSSAITWSGTLKITGNFVSGSSIRFGTTSSGLTATQLGNISLPGGVPAALNSSGYLTAAVIAPNLTYTTGAGSGVRILVSSLITSNGTYSSQGSPSWTIVTAGPTSTQGGAVSNGVSQMQYTAPNSSIASDTFTYTLSDGVNTSAAATVTINFVQQSGGTATLAVSGSTASGKLFGIPGLNYGIQRSTNTASGPYYTLSSPPLTNAVLPITAAGDGSVRFSDTNCPNSSAFYRLIQQ